MKTFDTPILFLIFNRIETTQKVFLKIKELKPKYLYIAADGPRISKPEEKDSCQKVRNYILEQIDWNCNIKTLFREKNLGCGKAVSEAINWFFNNVEEGIILEDDCLPNNSFFYFCEKMLNFYKTENKIFMISGFNPYPRNIIKKWRDYEFIKIPYI